MPYQDHKPKWEVLAMKTMFITGRLSVRAKKEKKKKKKKKKKKGQWLIKTYPAGI